MQPPRMKCASCARNIEPETADRHYELGHVIIGYPGPYQQLTLTPTHMEYLREILESDRVVKDDHVRFILNRVRAATRLDTYL